MQPSRASLLAAAARRFTILLAGIAALTAIGAALLGLAFGTPLNRAVSLGFYCVGSFMLLGGFFFGNRGPARLTDGVGEDSARGRRRVYWASRDERVQAINESAIFISLGLVLILIGVLVDARLQLL